MEDNKNKTKVDLMYDDLYEQGYLEKDRDTFNKFFYAPGEQGYKNRKALYDDLHEQGYLESPTYEDFAKGIGLHAVQQSQPVVQAGTGPAAGGRQDLVESLNQYGEGLKAQSAPAAGNVANAADPSSRGGGAGRSWSDGENVVRRPGNVAVPYTGIKKTDPVTGEQYRVYTGAAAANADTVPSELQGRDLLDENGNLISARQWQSKYGDKPHLAGAAGLWNGGDLEYGTVLDSHIQKAIDLGMKHGDHSRMSTDELKAKRQELTDRYANGFTETPESLQDAIDLNNIDYELTARHLGYKSSDDMMKNHRGEADFELNKGRLNQDDLDFYEKQGSHVHNLGDNPLYVYGWQKFTDLAKRNEELGQSMSVEDYINALMADPDIENKFYAWTLTRAKKNNRSWASNINEAMDDFRKAISRGENPWEYAPEEKDVMAEFYGGELDRMDAEYEKELEAWQKRYDAWSANRSGLGWSHAPLGSYAAETGDNALGMIHTAQNLSKDARSVIDEAMKTGRGFSLSGEVGASVRGFRDSALDWRTWTFGITDLEDSKNMYNVAKKWKDGGQLNKAEQMLLDQMVLKAASDAFFNDYLSTGYEAGKTTGYALEFIAEMLTGAGAATDVAVRAMGSGLKKLGKKKVVQLLERIGMKGIVDGTLKKLGRATAKFGENKVGKVISKAIDKGTKLADEVVSVSNKGIGQTLGPGIAKVGAQTFENATGQAQGKFNPNTGRMEATSDSFADGMDFIESTKKAVKSEFGENASEFLGDSLLEPGIKWVNKFYRGATDKAFKKFGMKEAREFLDSLKGNDWYRFVQDFRKQVHYNGSFGEYCEEVANNIYDAAFVGDQNFNSPDDPNSVFNFKKNFRTYVSCKYMSLAFGAANVAGYRTPKYRANQDVKYADQIAKRAFVGEDWGSISSIIRDGSDEQVEQLMVDIAQSKKYNARQRQAAINYAGAVAAQKGIEAGDVKVERSAGDQEAREAYGRGYNMENLESLSAASGEYNRLRAEMERDYGAELMERMDSEPGLVYGWVRAGAVSEDDAKKVLDYLNAKMAYEGAVDRLNDDDAAAKAAAEAHIDDRVHTEDNGGDGQIHPVALKGREGDFFVVSGNVVASDEDGNVDVNASDNDIVVVDSEGKRIMTHAKDIAQVGDAIDPEAAKAQAVAQISSVEAGVESGEDLDSEEGRVESTEGFEDTGLEDTDTTTGTAAAQGALPVTEYNQDDLVTVEVDGQRVNGIVTNGLDDNGNVTLYLEEPINGRQNVQLTPEQLNQVAVSYTSRDGETIARSAREEESGERVENNGIDEVQDETPQQAEQPRYAVNPESLQGNEGDNFLNNTAAYLNGDMSAEDYLTSQGWNLDGFTPEQIKSEADSQAQWAMPHLVEEQPAAPVSEEVSGEPSDDEAIAQGTQSQVPTSGEYSVQSEEAAAPSGATQQAPAQEQPQQAPAQPSLPVGEDGNADFSNATPQEAHDYIYNDPELDEDEANEVVRSYAAGAQTRLDEAQAALKQAEAVPAPKMEDYRSGNAPDVAGYKRAKRERNETIAQAQAAVDAAQREVDLWNGVQAQHMMSRAANRAEQRGQREETPAAPSAPAPVSGESENNAPTPSQATPPQGQQTTESTQEPSAPQPNEGNVPMASTTPSSNEEERGESAPVNETAGAAEEELTPDERIERARMEALENRAEELAESCGLPVQVARSLDDLSDRHRREVEKQHAAGKYVNGFYDPMTKQIVLFLPDIAKNGGMRRLERTFLHEGVAHGGLRALFENAQNGIQTFDELCDQVWEMMPVVTQAQMMNYIGVQKPEDMTQEKKRIAADEYMAHLAEWGVEQSVKSRIISAVKNALRKIGVKMKLSNNDIVSLLAASRRKLNEMDKVGLNSAISEALDNDGEDEGEGVRMSTTAIFEGAGLEVSRDATDNEGKPTKEPLTDSKGNLVARIGDKEFSVDNPVKAEDLKPAKMGHAVKESSVLHMLIEDSKKYSGLSDAQADKIYQNYADLLNMYLYMGSAAMGGPETVTEAWEWLGDSVFRTIAANGDAQYSYSMDIIRVCKKNEAVIKAMSALQLREGRGATPSEIVELYRETHEDGYQVPCPVCYVFTRYIRNGKYASAAIKGMEKWGDHLPGGSDVWSVDQWVDALDKIQRETNPDYKPDGKNKMKGKELEKAKRFKKQLDQANKITVAYEKRVNALSYLLTTDDAIKAGTIKNKVLELTPERRASIEKELDIINEQYQHAVEIIAHQALSNWIKTHAIEEKDGKWTMREDARKPEDIDDYKRNALDLRLTSNTIVNYPAIQRLRKSGGSAAGKEISFASDNRLGEVVSGLGINKTNLSGYKNKYEEALNATGRARNKARNEARKRFKDATVYALMQTLRGGQRMWSWSDNIERLSPDIAINIMQLQLLGGAMQTYSKQLEGIKLAAQMGAYVNGSLMAKDNGYQEVTDKDVEERDGKLWLKHDITDEVEEYPVGGGEPKPRKRIVAAKGSYVYQAEDGKKYVLIYDDVVGVDPFGNELHGKGKKKGLFQLNQEYDRAGNILVGMNDLHVRAAMADPAVFFIIPWHSSGANNHILNQMLNILEQTMTDRLDYTAMQEEKNMLERNKNTKELPEVNKRLRDLWEEGRQWAKQNKWKSGMEVYSNGDVITESQYMYRQLRAQIFNGNIFEAMPSEEQYRAAVEVVNSMQATMDELDARNEAWKAKSPEYKKSPEGKAEKKAIDKAKGKAKNRYNPALHTIELHDGMIDWRDSSQHEGDAEWQAQHPKRINVEEARRMIENDEFLSQVLKRVEPIGHMTNGDNTYIYPYEYWDESSTYDTADINGKRYVEYCRRMGYKPKFSGRWGDKVTEENMNDGNFVHDPGYWKLLIDRRMYDRNGKYQWLDPVESENFEPDLVNPLKTGEEFNITQVADDKDAEDIAERVYNNMAERDGGVAKVDYSKPLEQIMDEYDAALAAGVQANVKLTEAEEDALDDMEEAIAEEGDGSGVMFSTSGNGQENSGILFATNNNIDQQIAEGTGRDIKDVARERKQKIKEFKQLASDIYPKILSGEIDDVTLQQIYKYIDYAEQERKYGTSLSKRLPQEVERSVYEGELEDEVDALFTRAAEGAVTASERSRASSWLRAIEIAKRRALEAWAKATGHWYTSLEDIPGIDSTEPIGNGTESFVYDTDDPGYVIKVTTGKPPTKRFAQDPDGIHLFNYLFPNARYEIIGYGDLGNGFVRITRQPKVIFAEEALVDWSDKVKLMADMGFRPYGPGGIKFTNGTIYVADLGGTNVVRDIEGNIRVVDADVGLHTGNLGGEYRYPPVENDVLFSTSPTFYSNAERAVENIKQNKATAEQWKAMLTKAGGIKSGEDKWMGLSQWLDENKGKSLTKEEVLQFVRDNGIQMEEANYGDIYETSGYVKLNDEYMALRNDAERIFQEANKQFADYVEEMEAKYGDDYYRQMTPQERQIYNRLSIDQELRDPNIYNYEDIAFREMVDRYGDDFEMAFRATSSGLGIEDSDAASYFAQDVQAINSTRIDYTTDGLENKREIAFVVPNVEPYQEHDEVHFGPENQGKAVMWVRFGETTDADGNRVLVIDEIQSNRHQDAREKGYSSSEETKAKAEEAKKEMEDFIKQMQKKYKTQYWGTKCTHEENVRYHQLSNRYEWILNSGVPAAPFEKNWHEVAMKRMLRLAAEEGFDKVAWTTGEQQAKRYNLGRMYDSIEREDNPSIDGKRFVLSGRNMDTFLVNKEGNIEDSSFSEFNGKPLSDVVGKDMAERMMNLEDGDILEGEQLNIGGEGMKGFYDKMLPRFMDKYGKRWGVKTGTVELPNVEEAGRTMHSVDVTPEMKESVMQGQPLFSTSYSLGVPYQGTKGRIARSLMEKLPSGRRFVDLFAGGGAMTHAAMLSGKYDEYLMNDVNPVGVELFMQGIRGEWDDYNRTSMTPEEFKQIKGTPEAIPWSVLGLGRNLVKGGRPDYINRVKRLGELKGQADKVSNSFEDYRNVEIRPGDVVYADIPYENTDTYNYGKGRKFDKKAFCDWAQAQDFPVFVSESVMPAGWVEIASESMKTINPKKNRVEKLWVQEKFAGEYEPAARNTEQEPEVDGGLRFSVREKPEPKKTIPVYKLMRLGDDGKLYPLFIDGTEPIELGVWYDADSPNMDMLVDLPIGVHLIDTDNGTSMTMEEYVKQNNIKLKKGQKYPPKEVIESTPNGQRWVYIEPTERGQRRFGGESRRYWNLGINGSGSVSTFSMRPGWHAGSLPTMRQIGKSRVKGGPKTFRDDRFVWVEGLISADIDYNEEAQRNPDNDIPTHIPTDGFYLKATNANAKASQADRVGWYISGAFMPVKIMSDSEARQVIDKWNADPKHADLQVEYDFPRESGKVFNAETMQLEDEAETRFSTSAAVAALKDDERVYNDLLGKVFSGVSNETRRGIVEDAMRNRGNDFGAATEAWLGGLADDGKFADVDRRDWGRVKLALHQALMDNGVDVSEPLTDGESRYVLWKAGQVDDGVFSMAEDIVKRGELLNGARAPQYTDSADVRFSTSSYDVIKAAREAASGEPYANGYGASSYHRGTTEDGDNYTIRVADHPLKWENLESHGDLDGRVLSIVITGDPGNVNDWKESGFEEVTDRDGYDVEQYILNADDVDIDMLTDAIENYKKTGRSYRRNEDGELVGIQEAGNGIMFSTTPMDRAIARDQYERWMKNGRLQWVESMQDSMLGLKKLMQSIMGNNWTKIEDVPMYENPYIAENLMSSVTAAQQQAFYTEFMKPLLEEVGKLCKGGKKAREKAREELTNYLMAKHGLERNQVLADRDAQETAAAGGDYQDAYAENRERDYSGLTALTGEDDVHAAEAKAQQMVDDYESQHDTTELWNRINAATQVTLEKQYKSGMLSYAEYQRISDMFEYYVPLRGWEETTSDEVYGYLTSKAGPFLGGGIVKRAGGRTSKADDPIATIAQMGDDSIRTGNRNLMKQTFLNFVQNHPSDAVSVSDLWLQYDDVTDEWVPVFADIDPNDSPEVVEQKIQDFEQRMQDLANQEPDKYKHGREAANIPYRVIPGMEKEHQVLVKRNGQTWVLTINGNPRAAQALNGLTNPDVPMEGAWASMIKGAEWVNRTLSALYTTLSPAFIVSNFLRDTGYSNTMVWVRESPNYALRFNKNYLKLNPGTLRWLLGKWEEGTLDESKPLQKHFKEFMLNGGETGFAMVQDLEKYKKNMLNEVKGMNSKNFVKKGVKLLGSQYELLGRSIENCARFAAYVTSREMGRSAERAAYDAKEISVNFNKKGSGGKSLGKVGQTKTGNVGAFVSGMARSLYTFWNAGVQGMTNAGRAVKRHPVKAALMGVGPLYAAGFLAPVLAQLMGAGGDGDDDKNAYYNLPEYVRRSNLCIWLGDAWLTIPLPIEFRSIYGLGELTYGVISGNERYSDEELAMQVAGQFSQLLPIDMLEGGGGFHPFIPTLLKPVVEAEQNKSWSGLPIYRSSEWNKDDPEYTKAFSNANEWIVSGAEWLNAKTGGDEFKKGWLDLNPAKIEYMLKGYLGGIYTTIDEVRRAAETALGSRDFEWRNIPLANRVIKQGDERTESKKLRDEYFKYKEDYENTKHLINKYKNAENTDLFDYAKKLDLLNNSKEYGRYLIFEKYATMLDAYQKAKKGASGEVLKKIEEDEKVLMRQLVDEMHAFEDGKLTVGDRPKLSKKDRSEDYGYMYNRLRTYVDINEDALLDSALKRAKAADDKGLVAALNSIKRSISEMKKGLGRGKDEEVMNSIRQMRNSVLQSFGIIGGGEEEPPEVEEQWQEEPQEDWGDEGNADFDEPIEPYPDDEGDEYDY